MPHAVIIGAGPGGLLCALMLQRRAVPVTVYESDTSLGSRTAGGTLDLHADTGQIALEDAGLLEQFMTLARPEGQAKKHVDGSGKVLSDFVPADGDVAAPEIDREQLRSMLAEQLDPGVVQWGHALVDVQAIGDGRHRLTFQNGEETVADLLIGADGAWSKVRTLVSDAKPVYTGVSFLDVCFDDADVRHPATAQLVGDGHLFANDGDGRSIILQRNSNHRIRGYVAMRTDAQWHEQAGIDLHDHSSVRAHLRQQFDGWSPDLRAVVSDSDSYTNRGMWVLPAPMRWAGVPGVTLLGDAAHVMSPFGGHGVNLALLDGAELAHAIADEPSGEAAIARYESRMLPRSAAHAIEANRALALFFALEGSATPDELPDHDDEHERYRLAAAEYRSRQHPQEKETTMTADGTWSITYHAGGGVKKADIVLSANGHDLNGTFDGIVIQDGHVEGGDITFTAKLVSPFPMTMKCTATTDADTITGRAKVPMMTFPFSGTRTA